MLLFQPDCSVLYSTVLPMPLLLIENPVLSTLHHKRSSISFLSRTNPICHKPLFHSTMTSKCVCREMGARSQLWLESCRRKKVWSRWVIAELGFCGQISFTNQYKLYSVPFKFLQWVDGDGFVLEWNIFQTCGSICNIDKILGHLAISLSESEIMECLPLCSCNTTFKFGASLKDLSLLILTCEVKGYWCWPGVKLSIHLQVILIYISVWPQ